MKLNAILVEDEKISRDILSNYLNSNLLFKLVLPKVANLVLNPVIIQVGNIIKEILVNLRQVHKK